MPRLSMRASFAPATVNDENRTVEVVFTTGARVKRQGWFSPPYFEELSLDKGHVRLDRLNGGAPLLDSHGSFDMSLDDVIGVVEEGTARVENGRGLARVRFSRGERGEGAFREVKDGILRNISVGYQIHKMKRIKDELAEESEDSDSEDVIPVFRAIDWEPHELSLVPIPADAAAQVRSGDVTTNPCEFVTRASEEPKMAKMKKKAKPSTTTAAAPATARAENPTPDDDDVETDEERAEDETEDEDVEADEEESEGEEVTSGGDDAAAAGRALPAATDNRRAVEMLRLARALRITDEKFVERHLEKGTPMGKFRRIAVRKAASDAGESPILPGGPRIEAVRGGDPRDKFRHCAVSWLLMRSGLADQVAAVAKKRGESFVVDPGEVAGMTLLRLAEECIVRAGIKVRGMNPLKMAEIAFDARAGGFQTTSDFPVILDQTVDRALLAGYELAPHEWRKLAKVGSLSNFKPSKRIRLGSMGRLDRVPQHAEFKNKPLPDGVEEEVQLETFGNIVAITRQVIIDDDLGAVLSMAGDIGLMAGETIELEFWDLLNQNGGLGPDMADGKPLFDPDHNNIQTDGTALSEAGLDANRLLMGSQTDQSGKRIVMRPTVLLVSLAQGSQARKLNTAEFDMDAADGVTPSDVRGLFRDIIDSPYVTSPRRYLFADPQRNPTFEVNFLNGQQTPFTESRDGWRIDGKEYKVRHDFGVDAVDYRTAVTDDGLPPS